MKKILIITNHSYMLWKFRRELIRALLKENEVVLAMPFVGHEKDFEEIGCKCIEIKLKRRSINPFVDYNLYLNYIKLLKLEKPDKVITYSIKPNIYGGYACAKLGIPYYVNVQGLGTKKKKKVIEKVVTLMYKKSLKKVNTVFFENNSNADEFLKRKIVSKDKIKVLNGAGVDLDYFGYKEYPSEDDGIHFLFVGRIMKEKGIDELFEAAVQIKKKYGEKVKFDVVGFFEDEYKEKVEKLVEDGVIIFHGFQEDPRPYYEKAHCVVLPSYHEGMSNVLLEAAATGRAIIASDIPGCREAIDDGENGYLCKKENLVSLINCIEKFINLNYIDRSLFCDRSRKKVKDSFDKEKIVKMTMDSIID